MDGRSIGPLAQDHSGYRTNLAQHRVQTAEGPELPRVQGQDVDPAHDRRESSELDVSGQRTGIQNHGELGRQPCYMLRDRGPRARIGEVIARNVDGVAASVLGRSQRLRGYE